MKLLFTFLCLSLLPAFVFAQSPMKSTVEYNGQKYPCYLIEYNLPPDETEEAIKEKLSNEGYKPDKSKGFFVYRDVRLEEFHSNESQDVLFKVERLSRKDKDKSIVTMIIAKAGQIPKDKVKGAKIVANIDVPEISPAFLTSFQEDIDIAAYNLSVDNQVNVVAKAEKKLEGLRKDQQKLEKKIKDFQQDLEKNKKNQENQIKEIAAQKTILQQKKDDHPVE